MTDRAAQTIKELRAELDELSALVRGFGDEDLARTSGAAEWDVSQVLSHLGSGAEITLAAFDGAVNGTGSPTMEVIRGIWARWDGMSRGERAEAFVTANEALLRRLEELDAGTREELRIELWFPGEPASVARLTGMRLSEFAHHSWDVKVAFDPAATLAPGAVELLLDQVGGMFGYVGKPEALGGRQVAVAVHTTAPARSFGLDLGPAMAITGVPAEADVVLTTPAEFWLRLVYGRHAPEHTPSTVDLSGDAVTLDDLRRVFPGF
ncbi:maleylpyruvate isomerase family mycothiol-dependent enzyme [Nonomuraea jiangxiensis]|uniref:TIGR03083 family protein n=1 Tax=Nonomuraea jiangxiensis TaxID=633440 RepID=A0A1G9QIM2_9ACTN|nr:maleylpyruvate isomerase family mycothiol-dependent enzyme [Nonomuraea jiangxiensis]SDM10859.1 TIGR03083 family protein [Nonomuraea jiangxiensis]